MNQQRRLLHKKSLRAHGFAAIAAIFLVVVLAALGAFMVTFSNTQQLTSAQDVQGTRAYLAARAGLEWGVASVVKNSVCPTGTLSGSFDGGFSVVVACDLKSYTEGSTTPNNVSIYRITATAKPYGASTVGSVGYVERSLTVTLELATP